MQEKTFLFLVTVLSVITVSRCLDCFQCISAWTTRECMQRDPQTCGWGQICHNTVERGGFAGVKYSKGCMDDSHCYSLQNLNSARSCDQDPSICVYCCEGELCNAAVAQFPLPVIYTMTTLLTFTLLS